MGFPQAEYLVDSGPKVSYFTLVDDAFPLGAWSMTPISKSTMDLNKNMFNTRLVMAGELSRMPFAFLRAGSLTRSYCLQMSQTKRSFSRMDNFQFCQPVRQDNLVGTAH